MFPRLTGASEPAKDRLLRTNKGSRKEATLKANRNPPHCTLALTLPKRARIAYQDRNEDLACADHV